VLKYVDAAQPFSQEQPPLITTTVQEYDTSQLKGAVKTAFMGIGMMGVMHLYFGYTQPLLVQSIMPIKNVVESNIAKIHLLRNEPVGDLKRPWKTGGLFAGAGDVSPPLLSFPFLVYCELANM
jgi:Phosphate transport (Pho88)